MYKLYLLRSAVLENSVHSYEPTKLMDLLFMPPHFKMYDSTKSFTCMLHNLQVEIIKQIQVIASNHTNSDLIYINIMMYLMFEIIL